MRAVPSLTWDRGTSISVTDSPHSGPLDRGTHGPQSHLAASDKRFGRHGHWQRQPGVLSAGRPSLWGASRTRPSSRSWRPSRTRPLRVPLRPCLWGAYPSRASGEGASLADASCRRRGPSLSDAVALTRILWGVTLSDASLGRPVGPSVPVGPGLPLLTRPLGVTVRPGRPLVAVHPRDPPGIQPTEALSLSDPVLPASVSHPAPAPWASQTNASLGTRRTLCDPDALWATLTFPSLRCP